MSRERRFKGVPDKWLDYSSIQDVIKDIRIVPFKVPLPVKVFENSSLSKYKWTPADVMHALPDLGLVIDLTFKFPCYYKPVEFLENGIDWIKIPCGGHIIPPRETFIKFFETIDKFRRQKPDLIVGVHCTHGVNRTGLMICSYMVEICGYDPEEALKIFSKIRGHEVERVNYRQHVQLLSNP